MKFAIGNYSPSLGARLKKTFAGRMASVRLSIMSHEDVRVFYRKLSESSVLAASYTKLTYGWFGYSESKIVAFAASHGCQFTKSELAFIRLTNVLISGGRSIVSKGSNGSVECLSDYEPTLHPKKPFSARMFYEDHNRHVDGMPKVVTNSSKLPIEHQMEGGICQRCGCSETFIASNNARCR